MEMVSMSTARMWGGDADTGIIHTNPIGFTLRTEYFYSQYCT